MVQSKDHDSICEFDEVACRAMHGSIETRFNTFGWVIGLIISLQLATFGWLGFLSSKVITMDTTFQVTKATIEEKLAIIGDRQQKVLSKLETLDNKIDGIIVRNAGIDGPPVKPK